MINRGKQFEAKFREDWEKCFGKHTIDRLYDSVSGYRAISNIADFIGYHYPNIFYLECKAHKGASFPFSNLTQYEKLKVKVGLPGVRAGVILWLEDKDQVIYLPIATVTAIMNAGIKSFNPDRLAKDKYRFFEIPSIKKRVFLDSDYSVLAHLEDGD